MEQQVITDISLSARIIGAAFYYPPTEKSDIVELLSSGKWLTEWPYGSEEEKQRIASLLAQTTYQDETLLAEHLLPWAYRYLEKLSLQGAFPYYEGLAMLATLTLKSWQSLLSITPVEKQLFC